MQRSMVGPLQTKRQRNEGKELVESMCESTGCQNFNPFPWVWEIGRSSARPGILSQRNFQMVENFIHYLRGSVRLHFRRFLTQKATVGKILTYIQ